MCIGHLPRACAYLSLHLKAEIPRPDRIDAICILIFEGMDCFLGESPNNELQVILFVLLGTLDISHWAKPKVVL